MIFFQNWKFINLGLIKKWPLWLVLGLYFAFLALLIYITPMFFESEYLLQTSTRILMGLLIVFGGISSVLLSIYNYRTNIEDGIELLLVTKGITKFKLLVIKTINLLTWIIAISLLALAISSGSYLLDYDSFNYRDTMLLGSLVGTLVLFLVWSSFTIIVSSIINSHVAMTILIGLNFIFYLIPVITIALANNNWHDEIKKDKITFNEFALVSPIDNKTHKMNYSYGMISQIKEWYPIEQQTKINNSKISLLQKDLTHFNQNLFEMYANKDENNPLFYIDFNTQMVEIFSLFSHFTASEKSKMTIYRAINKQAPLSMYFKLKFNPVNLENVNKQIDGEFIAIPKIDKEYHLILSPFIEMDGVNGGERIISKLFYENQEGSIDVNSSIFNGLFPILKLDSNTNNWTIHNFSNLQEFGNYYYNVFPDIVAAFCDEMMETVGSEKNLLPSRETLFFSLMLTYLIKNYYDKHSEFSRVSFRREVVNPFSIWAFNFQYWTYMLLNDLIKNPETYPWRTNDFKVDTLLINLRVFNLMRSQSGSFLKHKFSVYFGTPLEMIDELQNRHNGMTIGVEKWTKTSLPLGIISKSELATFSDFELLNTNDDLAILISWVLISCVLLFLGNFTYYKKDIF